MLDRWFLTHAGQTLGPLSREQLLGMLQGGQVALTEHVWAEGTDVRVTVQAYLGIFRAGKLPGWIDSLRPLAAPPATRWYYARGQQKLGPHTLEEMQQLTARGELRPEDLVYRQDAGGWSVLRAKDVLPFPAAAASGGGPLPSWLDDVVKKEPPPAPPKPAPPPPPPTVAVPDWLADVQPGAAPAPRPAPPPSVVKNEPARIASNIPLDWLDDIRQIEESLQRRPAVKPVAAPPAAPIPAPVPADPKVMGYDPETGQILDPAAYARWQRQEQQRRQEELQRVPTISVSEAFVTARRELETWVDADGNKALVIAGDVEAIRQSPQVQAILRPHERYGPVMLEKLGKHLAFLVENRRKFYAAFAGKV